jgi:hypothetical protein
MAVLALVNPSPRPSLRKKRVAKKRTVRKANPATKPAEATKMAKTTKKSTKKTVAKAVKRSGLSHTMRTGRTRTAKQQERYEKRVAGNTQKGYYPNPIRGRRAKRRVKRRSNPINTSQIKSLLKGAVTGAAGAIAVDFVWNQIPAEYRNKITNDTLKSGARLGLALALGMVAQKVAGNKPFIKDAVEGSMIVNLHGLMKDAINGQFPSLQLSGGGSTPTNRVNWDFSQSSMNGLPLNGLPLSGASMGMNNPLAANGALSGLNLDGEYL